ncbi:LOW QUALITY PROTEIN: Fras1 related extracellular matrix protein [Elysia marginata]|uniref:Fras1 related extracellular matrix protein n=1 Tax=Elysia marginata TaxID=1093978 RepID=A0AAV4IGU6_9GAST|nr:LOW QUALITY PROTEIN: Fras1 related extracellular matrix protein [Elysia marginata]
MKSLAMLLACSSTPDRLVLPVVDQTVQLKIEGGGESSGGLPADLMSLMSSRKRRERREAGHNSTQQENATVVKYETGADRLVSPGRHVDEVKVMYADPPTKSTNEETREPSVAELMALAERLRELRETDKLQKYLDLQGSGYRMGTSSSASGVDDDYVAQNSVDYTVERQYEEDLKQHEKYKDFVLEANRASQMPNMSRVTDVLRDDVMQMRERHEQRYQANLRRRGLKSRRKRASVFDDLSFDRMMRLMRWKSSVSKLNCHTQPNHRLTLPGDVGYGASRQFENEGRTAVRLSNFLSMYLQNVMPDENFGNMRGGGPLHKDMMFGEVIANVMGNYRIYSAGVYFDRWKFENDDGSPRELFGPWAFRRRGAYFAEDTAGYSAQYVNTEWFRRAKSRHGANFSGTKKYKLRTYVR